MPTHLTLVVCCWFGIACAAAPAAAQTADDTEALKARYPDLTKPENMHTAAFFLDPALRRIVATPEIETHFNTAYRDVLQAGSDLSDAQHLRAIREGAVINANTALTQAQADLDAAVSRLSHVQSQLNDLSVDEVQGVTSSLQDASLALQKAKERLSAAEHARDDAVADEQKVSKRLTAAQLDQTNAVHDRERWLADHPTQAAVALQRDTVLVRFHRDTPFSVLDAFLNDDALRLRVRSGVPRIVLFVLETKMVGPSDPKAAKQRLTELIKTIRLKYSQWVWEAIPNTLLGPTSAPRKQTSATNPRFDWFTGEGTSAAIAMNFPAAWNLRGALRPENAPTVAVFDVAFAPHDDLQATEVCPANTSLSARHGNHVAGIIGARFNNGVGVDGGAPIASLITCAPGAATQSDVDDLARRLSERGVPFSALAQRFDEVARNFQPKIVNVSLGYRFNEDNHLLEVNANQTNLPDIANIQSLVVAHGTQIRELLAAYPKLLVVSAAGNECVNFGNPCNVSAAWSSPFNWAALGGQDVSQQSLNVLVVQEDESNRNGVRVLTSSIGGTIAAPGQDVVSTIDNQQYDFDSGTSQATPQITALVAMLMNYQPGLDVAAIRNILNVGQTAIPDAFIAMALAKPDDYARDISDLDGDGKVDRSDFERFKLDYADYVQGLLSHTFNRDLNEDGDTNSNDVHFPRCDLNGDGKLSLQDRNNVPVRDVNGVVQMMPKSDLEVMLMAWPNHPPQQDLEKELTNAAATALLNAVTVPAAPANAH